MDSVGAFLRGEMRIGSFAGASWAVGDVEGIDRAEAAGNAVSVPLRIPATTATLYDCASLTKPLVTGVLILQAIAEGVVRLDDEFRGFRFRELLTHTSGLRPWLPLYAFEDRLRAIEEKGPAHPRGVPVYSDLNFVLLHHAIGELIGDFREAARSRIFAPLALETACFDPPASLRPRIAATEWGQVYERRMCGEQGYSFDGFREGLVWGEVHDGNSFHGGGTLGNAGLFATAGEVFRMVQAFARGELVPAELVREATRTHAGDRGLAWQTRGPGLSPDSWGHTGFTGTSAWFDEGRIFVLLTNRVHPCAASIAMQKIRGDFHERAKRESQHGTLNTEH